MLQFSLIKPYHVIIATFINYLAGTHITLQQSFIQLKTMTNRGDWVANEEAQKAGFGPRVAVGAYDSLRATPTTGDLSWQA